MKCSALPRFFCKTWIVGATREGNSPAALRLIHPSDWRTHHSSSSIPSPRKGSNLKIQKDSPSHRGRAEAVPIKIQMSNSDYMEFESDLKHGFVRSPRLRNKKPHNYALI